MSKRQLFGAVVLLVVGFVIGSIITPVAQGPVEPPRLLRISHSKAFSDDQQRALRKIIDDQNDNNRAIFETLRYILGNCCS